MGHSFSRYITYNLLFVSSFIYSIYSFKAFCLVEYSSKSELRPKRANTILKKKKSKSKWKWELGMEYETHKIISDQSAQSEGKANFYILSGKLQTNFDMSLNVNYWHASLIHPLISSMKNSKKGNVTTKIGLNWLHFGEFPKETVVNLYGGVMFPSKNSSLGSSRTDKIFNFETVKRFNNFSIELNYELRLTGEPSEYNEISIGNVQIIGGGIFWMATTDIRFAIEGAHVEIRAIEEKKNSFSYISPQLHLLLSPMAHLKMGTRMRKRRQLSDPHLLKAKIWNLKAGYSNSLWAGLSILI